MTQTEDANLSINPGNEKYNNRMPWKGFHQGRGVSLDEILRPRVNSLDVLQDINDSDFIFLNAIFK